MASIPNKNVYDTKKQRNELEKVLEENLDETFIFPADLDVVDHWIAFHIHRQEFRRKQDFAIKESLGNIFLPIPASLGTQYDQTYNEESLGLGAKMAENIDFNKDLASNVESIRKGMGGLRDAALYVGAGLAEENISTIAGGLAGNILGGTIGSTGVGAAVGNVAGKAFTGALAKGGFAANPYMAVLYDSPTSRTHTFTWKLIPKNEQESRILHEIIHKFKFHSSPGISLDNPHFFDYPEQFEIDFHYAEYLFNIGPSVCTSFSPVYHAEGQPLYHKIDNDQNRAPVSVEISATFKEIAFVDKNTITRYNR